MIAAPSTVTLTGPDNLVHHIEGLQATLTRRNARIAELEGALDRAIDGEPTNAALLKAYRQGWKAAATRLMFVIGQVEGALAQVSDLKRNYVTQIHFEADIAERPAPSTEGEAA